MRKKADAWGIVLVGLVAGCSASAPPTVDTGMSRAQLREKLEQVIAHGGPESPSLPAMYEKHDVTSVLIDLAISPDINWYRRLTEARDLSKEEIDYLRGGIWDNIFGIFDHFRDERGYLFQIQAYLDPSQPYIVRMNALRHFWNANLPEVRKLFIHILEDHVQRKIYGADGLLVLQYIRYSTRLKPNHLWDTNMKRAVDDYLEFLKNHMKVHPELDTPPTLETMTRLVREAILELDRNE